MTTQRANNQSVELHPNVRQRVTPEIPAQNKPLPTTPTQAGKSPVRIALQRLFRNPSISSPWNSKVPIRGDPCDIECLEEHARNLAMTQAVSPTPPRVASLRRRLNDNACVLLAVYRASASEQATDRGLLPAAAWLLDNHHFIEEQIHAIRHDQPRGYDRQLPKLAEGPFAGYPRVFGLAWAYVAHTDSQFDPDTLRRFIAAYQEVQPLTIAELWAIALTLRTVLIENLRRLAEEIAAGIVERDNADVLAGRMLAPGCARSVLNWSVVGRSTMPLPARFVARLAEQLTQGPNGTAALGWLEERLQLQDVSIDAVLEHAQHIQRACNVSVRNAVTSMRLISELDWTEFFESVSLVDAWLRTGSAFAQMDFPTRNLYRGAIEQLARGSSTSELDITSAVLRIAQSAANRAASAAEAERVGDPGYHLIAEGREALERSIVFRPPVRLRICRAGIGMGIRGYVGAILLVTLGLLAISLSVLPIHGVADPWRVLFALFWFIPVSEIGTALINRVVAWGLGARTLPGLELKSGVPQSLRTLVAVPILLTSEAAIREQIKVLEIHHLAGADGDLTFALLSDGVDADQEILPEDAPLLAAASEAIEALNRRYGPGPAGKRFLLLHRRRIFNVAEGKWMGWERKRGKLHELNRLLRGATDTSYAPVAGHAPQVPHAVRYVITLDSDTRLTSDAALRLIGKMAHPLNRPRFDAAKQRIDGGYAILQPRVAPSLPWGCESSHYQKVFSGPGGIDPYAGATSDVYQDLFGEGSYAGKGIYDVDAFEAALCDRVPENALLSHDLYEGIFARAGLASDVEVMEDFPSRYDVCAKRQHRWTRGDWQLLPWILEHGRGRRAVPMVGRWKMLDNLRRSLLSPFLLLALGASWLLPMPTGAWGARLLLAVVAIPIFLPSLLSLPQHRAGFRWRHHFTTLATDLRLAAMQTFLTLAFLPDHAFRMGDAILRTLVRLYGSHRHLLEWTTAAQLLTRPRPDLIGSFRLMAGGTSLALFLVAAALSVAPSSWPCVVPFALLWLGAPLLALWSSRPTTLGRRRAASNTDVRELRLAARRTWRFFETFVTPADHMLPPDNFQETPKPTIAHRTSPTNIGLYLLSAIAARDFGWAGTMQTVEWLEAALGTMRKLPRCMGHFFNWYGTRDLHVLGPAYISSVDSGNLAGHLIVLANACEEWAAAPVAPDVRHGMMDAVRLAREAWAGLVRSGDGRGCAIGDLLGQIDAELSEAPITAPLSPALRCLTEEAAEAIQHIVSTGDDELTSDLVFWATALRKAVEEHDRDRVQFSEAPHLLAARLKALSASAREMALAMNFAFLYDAKRKLLSIGYSLEDNRLDPCYYDLLASEARLASLFAIAKGDLPTRHWFRLGRMATPLGMGSALISWSGSMFEYLMPALVMRAPPGSLLEQSNRLVVGRQQSYGKSLGVPWGISESGYNARDMEFTYQYSSFGVPGLGLKGGLGDSLVVAPYATALAAMVDPRGARGNYGWLASIGGRGRYGFYEALDFTRARLPYGEKVEIVRSFMAHHQGMTIVAIANALHAGRMRERFHREPMIQAHEFLLQERVPRILTSSRSVAEDGGNSAFGVHVRRWLMRRRNASTVTPDAYGSESTLHVSASRRRGAIRLQMRSSRDTTLQRGDPRQFDLH